MNAKLSPEGEQLKNALDALEADHPELFQLVPQPAPKQTPERPPRKVHAPDRQQALDLT